MKIEAENNSIILKEAFSGITIETREGKKLNICLRDFGFDVNIDGGKWFHIHDESDFAVKETINYNPPVNDVQPKSL